MRLHGAHLVNDPKLDVDKPCLCADVGILDDLHELDQLGTIEENCEEDGGEDVACQQEMVTTCQDAGLVGDRVTHGVIPLNRDGDLFKELNGVSSETLCIL